MSDNYEIEVGAWAVESSPARAQINSTVRADQLAYDTSTQSADTLTDGATLAGSTYTGEITIKLQKESTWSWVSRHSLYRSGTDGNSFGSGSKATSAATTTIRLTTVGGTDTFDLGSANISTRQ